jgi:hypothetical protein
MKAVYFCNLKETLIEKEEEKAAGLFVRTLKGA